MAGSSGTSKEFALDSSPIDSIGMFRLEAATKARIVLSWGPLILCAVAGSACGGAGHADRPASLSPGSETRALVWIDEPAVDDEPAVQRLSRAPMALEHDGAHPYLCPHANGRLLSGYRDRRGRRQHRAVDIAVDAPDAGLGTPVFSMGRARVVEMGTPEDDPVRFGQRLQRRSHVVRGGEQLPTSRMVSGYGRVWFFTENYGTWRTGVVLVTELLDGPLRGHRVRYMHLGAIHPQLRVGDVVEAGQEIGIVGGTAILESTPHVHIDVQDPRGRRVDPTPYLAI